MSNDKNNPDLDDLTPEQLAQLEARLAAEEGSLDADEARELAQAGSPARAVRAGARAIGALERHKDAQAGLSAQIAEKYLAMGRQLLSDSAPTRLDSSVRDRVGQILGYDPGDVNIHTGERAADAADALGARAFAVGDSDIYFGRGEFNPGSAEGMGVLVHEMTHVVDNSVGAALSVDGGHAQYSAAEDRAEAAEQVAVTQDGKDLDTMGEGGHAHSENEDPIDMQKLEDAVAKLMERSTKLAADRTGASAGSS